jgi:hypothetical protein
MKITWDNIDDFKWSDKAEGFTNKQTYILREGDDVCLNCGDPYFSRKDIINKGKCLLCSGKCVANGELNPMFGKTHTDEVKEILKLHGSNIFKKLNDKNNIDNISKLYYFKRKKGQIIISFDNVSTLISKDGYTLLGIEGNTKHATLTVRCDNDHIFKIKYSSFQSGHRCKECYYDRLRLHDEYQFINYYLCVSSHTRKSYRLYRDVINPHKLLRKRGISPIRPQI